jgi:hypothetical protein
MNVGFIGLGRMGRGMARLILSGGHHLAVHDIAMSQAEPPLVAEGVAAAAQVADACKDRDVVVTMLGEDAAVLDIALRRGGLRDSLPAGSIHLATEWQRSNPGGCTYGGKSVPGRGPGARKAGHGCGGTAGACYREPRGHSPSVRAALRVDRAARISRRHAAGSRHRYQTCQ